MLLALLQAAWNGSATTDASPPSSPTAQLTPATKSRGRPRRESAVDTYAAIISATSKSPVTLPATPDPASAQLILQLLLQRPEILPRVIIPAVRVAEFIQQLCLLPSANHTDKYGHIRRGHLMQVVSWVAGQDWRRVRWCDPQMECLADVLDWDERLGRLENGQLTGKETLCSPFARIHACYGDEGLLRVLGRLDIQVLSKELLFLAVRARQPELLHLLYRQGYSKSWGAADEVVAAEWLCETEREAMLTVLVDVARRDGRQVTDWTRLLMKRDPEVADLVAVYFDAA